MSTERERFEEISKKIKRETDASSPHHQQMGRRPHTTTSFGLPGTLNTITPCAACKLLRRRCAQECTFSPYFSPHEPHKFASVHKVFGASNVSKLLMEVPENQRADAANSLVYEANVRLRDPVYGCMGTISALQQQIQSLQAELNAVRAEILRYKFSPHHGQPLLSSSDAVSVAIPAPVLALPPPQPSGLPHEASSSSSSLYTARPVTDYSTIDENAGSSYFSTNTHQMSS